MEGDDAALFSIENGELTFKKSPDFEAVGTDNMYSVTVQATDETNKVGMKEVTVEVTNVDEPGAVALSALQPQSNVLLTATHTDPDGNMEDGTISDLKWQWAKSSSKNGSYTDIDDATMSAYTPDDDDIDSYLRATASYTDAEGSGKSAMVESDNAVQAVRGANTAPKFADDQDPVMDEDQVNAAREVAENTAAGQAIGDPVVAEDEDGDILTYTLGEDGDNESFAIDRATGQLMTKGALNADAGGRTSYTVTVRATDPAGIPQAESADTANSDNVMVVITVTDVNEAPAVAGGAAVTFQEVTDAFAGMIYIYMAADPDEGAPPPTWSVAGADGGKFNIDDGNLTFKAQPDFEAAGDANGDNVYEVTVVAADGDGNRGTKDVKVTVENENEGGVVTLSQMRPRVGIAVRASLTDPDGSISGLTWEWSTSSMIEDANSDTYTPVGQREGDINGDVGEILTATASYTDGHGAGKTAMGGSAPNVVAVDTRNTTPAFEDQDTDADGLQNESTERKVEENAKANATDADSDVATDNVGRPVMATDPDPNEDALTYTLGGADAALFTVRNNGQIEVGAGTELDYETKQTYSVMVIAEDSFGASASIMVTITVTGMDETPDVTGEASIEYAENGTGPVATYMAVDPEGTAIASWSLMEMEGDDAALFSIENGELTFKKSPDFEAAGTDNMHSVTVQATDETNKVGMKMVTVEVTNVDEPGAVSLSALQPQSNVALTATHTDPDGNMEDGTISDLKWQWAKSGSKNGSYTDIEEATADAYTPDDADLNSYLRATASYTDAEGAGKSAMVKSDNRVQRVRGANEAPEFPDQNPDMGGDQSTTATRTVAENTAAGQAIGNPVVAEDGNGDILTYTLGEDGDNESFAIDRATGQLKTKGPLNFEGGPMHTVMVRATDPSGLPQAGSADPANSDTITVTINVTDVNEPPAVTGEAAVTFQEEAGTIGTVLGTYMAADPDEGAPPPTWSVAGADGGKFNIDDGNLTFKAQPDFEAAGDANKDNVYEVTVVAADADGNRGTMDVKVTVANEEEVGTVTLSKIQPRVGVAVRASLTDPDGSISGLTWQWSDGTDSIEDAISDTYTPVADDVAVTLTATASYTDGQGPTKTAMQVSANAVTVDTRNRAPVFADQDTETDGVQNESTERKVDENTKAVAADDGVADASENTADNVGGVVIAEDPDPNEDPLAYTLGGADAALFTVRDNGQIEVGAGTELDYETRTSYEVTVIATDSFGESATIDVTITVTDVNEGPVISVTAVDEGPDVVGEASIEYEENDSDAVATYTAADPEGAEIVWSLGGDGAALFSIEGGVLTFKKSPNFEMAADMDGDNMYSVTVQATDETGKMGTKEVTVEVTDVDEAPDVVGEASIEYEENDSDAVATYTAADPEGAEIVWSLGGDGAALFSIEGGVLTFKKSPNFEMAADMDGDNMYSVTVQATDETGKMGTKEVTVEVTDVDEGPDVAGEASIEYEENDSDAVATYTAADPEGAEIVWSLGGDDAALFSIEGGVLSFRSAPDFEMAADMDGDNVYQVTVEANDGTYMDTQDVTVDGHRRGRSAGCGRRSLHRIPRERDGRGSDLHGGGPRGCGDRLVAGWRRRCLVLDRGWRAGLRGVRLTSRCPADMGGDNVYSGDGGSLLTGPATWTRRT